MTIYSTRGNRHAIINLALLRYEFDEGVVDSQVLAVYNQAGQASTASNDLVSNSVRTPRVTFTPGYVSHNLRPPI